MRVTVMAAVAGAGVLAALLYGVSAFRAAQAQGSGTASPFVPDPNNGIRLSVRGWNRSELDKILLDFSKQYGLPPAATKVTTQSDKVLVITFPNDIEPKLLLFLVNYVQYPRDFDLKQRAIAAVAHAALTPAFGLPDSALAGKRAAIYVPANDTDYDLVYVRIEPGSAYRISFTNLIWKAVADPRMPAGVQDL